MEDIQISENNSLAHVLPYKLDTIFLTIPDYMMLDSEIVRIYNTNTKQRETVNMIKLVLSLIEHESMHIVLNKTVDIATSNRLDSAKINGLTLEAMLYTEHWLNNEV